MTHFLICVTLYNIMEERGISVKELHCTEKKEVAAAIETLAAGDCIVIDSFSSVAASAKELLSVVVKIADRGGDFVSLQEGVDTRSGTGSFFYALCHSLHQLDQSAMQERRQEGIERAREEGRYKGRKPIAVDEDLFESVVERWQDGQSSARQAMTQLGLTPNTFYRRIKEREELKMKGYKQVEHELRSEIKEAARQSRRDLGELKKQVRAEAKEAKKAASEALDLRDVEREMRKGRILAEAEHKEAVKQMKKDVEAEAKELKKLMEDK